MAFWAAKANGDGFDARRSHVIVIYRAPVLAVAFIPNPLAGLRAIILNPRAFKKNDLPP